MHARRDEGAQRPAAARVAAAGLAFGDLGQVSQVKNANHRITWFAPAPSPRTEEAWIRQEAEAEADDEGAFEDESEERELSQEDELLEFSDGESLELSVGASLEEEAEESGEQQESGEGRCSPRVCCREGCAEVVARLSDAERQASSLAARLADERRRRQALEAAAAEAASLSAELTRERLRREELEASLNDRLEEERRRREEVEAALRVCEGRLAAAEAAKQLDDLDLVQRANHAEQVSRTLAQELARWKDWYEEQPLQEVSAEMRHLEELHRVREEVARKFQDAKQDIVEENVKLRQQVKELKQELEELESLETSLAGFGEDAPPEKASSASSGPSRSVRGGSADTEDLFSRFLQRQRLPTLLQEGGFAAEGAQVPERKAQLPVASVTTAQRRTLGEPEELPEAPAPLLLRKRLLAT